MQNGGNYAKVKRVPPQPSSLWDENVGKIYSTWNPVITHIPHLRNGGLWNNVKACRYDVLLLERLGTLSYLPNGT